MIRQLQLKSMPPARTGESMSVYKNFEIETFELGPNQWHACFRNVDRSLPIVIDDASFGTLHVGVAWPTAEAALLDARAFIRSNDRTPQSRRLMGAQRAGPEEEMSGREPEPSRQPAPSRPVRPQEPARQPTPTRGLKAKGK
jgi:hypothetical protein